MASFVSDFRFAVRTLRHNPLFTAIAVLSLTLGIGANTAIFTLTDQLMLRLLPVKDPSGLVMLYQKGQHNGSNMGGRMHSYPLYQDFQSKAKPFSEVICRREVETSISVDNHTERVDAELVSGNFFTGLGVRPAAGRLFNSQEDDRQYRGHPVVVLSYEYWLSRFAGDARAVGRKILVNNYPMTIVGVSEEGFTGLDPARSPQVRIPILMKPVVLPSMEWIHMDDRRSRWVQVFARLKPGYTAESAQPSLQVLFSQLRQYEATLPAAKDWSAYARAQFLKGTIHVEKAAAGYSQLRNSFSTALVVLMCMVGVVLLIACANVSNLLIARAVARQKEIAVRLSLGASRGQLVQQLLIESLLLSLIGGVCGIFVSVWLTRGLLALMPSEGSALLLKPEPDLRILGFTLALTLLTGVLFGLVPAFRASRPDVWGTLKDSVGSAAGSGTVGLRKGLVTAQVALSFLLLFGAGLFVRSLQNLRTTDTGFHDIGRLITFQVAPALSGYNDQRVVQFYQELIENIRSVPGVRSAAFASVPLLRGWEWDSSVKVEGHEAKDGEDMQAYMNGLSPGYFQTMGIPLREGRDFERRDFHKDPRVCIVNRKFARHYFGGRSAVGRHLGRGAGPQTKLDVEIIGVVDDSLYEGPREGVRRQVFIPNWGNNSVSFYVRTALDSRTMYALMRGEVRKLDPAMPVYEMKTLGVQLNETLLAERLIAMLSAGFGGLATLLAAIGLYGVMAFVVARRTREIGVRMALGAQPRAVLWLVMKEVLRLFGVGLVIGIPAALILGRFVSSQLYGVEARDPVVVVSAMILLTAVAALAGLIPAQRASRMDPLEALRYE